MRLTLYRRVNRRWRYYKLSIFKNLFGEYVLLRQYGSTSNNHSSEMIDIFSNKSEAIALLEFLQFVKQKKGYIKKAQTVQRVLKLDIPITEEQYVA